MTKIPQNLPTTAVTTTTSCDSMLCRKSAPIKDTIASAAPENDDCCQIITLALGFLEDCKDFVIDCLYDFYLYATCAPRKALPTLPSANLINQIHTCDDAEKGMRLVMELIDEDTIALMKKFPDQKMFFNQFIKPCITRFHFRLHTNILQEKQNLKYRDVHIFNRQWTARYAAINDQLSSCAIWDDVPRSEENIPYFGHDGLLTKLGRTEAVAALERRRWKYAMISFEDLTAALIDTIEAFHKGLHPKTAQAPLD